MTTPTPEELVELAAPRRAHILKVEFGANTLDDLCYALRQMAIDLRTGSVSTKGASGSPSVGFTYEYDVDESWTKDRYFAALDEYLASRASQENSRGTRSLHVSQTYG